MFSEEERQIISTLQNIEVEVLSTGTIDYENLKIISLIFFNEFLNSHNDPNPVIKSYLTTILNNSIDLENSYQETPQEDEETRIKNNILHKVTHGKAEGLKE